MPDNCFVKLLILLVISFVTGWKRA